MMIEPCFNFVNILLTTNESLCSIKIYITTLKRCFILYVLVTTADPSMPKVTRHHDDIQYQLHRFGYAVRHVLKTT